MDASDWLGLRATHNPMRWVLPVTPGISTDKGFLFGGCALGAAIAAMEGSTERPVVWATAQYLSYTHPPSMLDIDVTVAVAGHAITQARAVAHVGDSEILTVNAALGTRDFEPSGVWVQPPEVKPPAECPARERPPWSAGPPGTGIDDADAIDSSPTPTPLTIMDRIDVRLANARPWEGVEDNPMPDGRSALWARMPDMLGLSSGAALAILGDYVPFGIRQALGRSGGGNSLDNTLRVYRLVPTEWVLLDIRIHAVANGFGHGIVHLWSEDRTLLATASQSTIVRVPKD